MRKGQDLIEEAAPTTGAASCRLRIIEIQRSVS